ncbi:Anti-sigma-I factor RsgI6 [Bulinus truncatus]|nr:Anti-sigma-I factor RsgI6 [Bulinus truncatus]
MECFLNLYRLCNSSENPSGQSAKPTMSQVVYFTLVSLLVAGGLVLAAPEILLNPGFENGINHWHSDGFSMDTDNTQVHGGVASVKCSRRTSTNQGPAQLVNLRPGGRYTFNGFIKLASDHGHQNVSVSVELRHTSSGPHEYIRVSNHHYMTAADGWVHIGGNFLVPNRTLVQARVYVEGPQPSVDFYFDDAALSELVVSPNWKTDANARIEANRKTNVHLNFHVASNFSVNDLKVKIDLTNHLFGFGSLFRADYLTNNNHQHYKDVVYYMFNWAVLQDYKWGFNKGTFEHPDYTMAVAATDELRRNGIQVRAHCLFWANQEKQPSNVTSLSGQSLRNAVDERIRYMTNITKGKVAHWDVYNEDLHFHMYETKTGDYNYIEHMFRGVHTGDPRAKLFLNDFNVVAQGAYTLSYLAQIQKLKAANVGLGGVGIQSHFTDFIEPDLTRVKHRLDVLSIAGVPLWITELDLSAHDENTKAEWYENVLRLYFSHPGVDGVLLWGFWDNYMEASKALANGNSITLNKAGQRYVHLTKQEWSTHVNRSLSSGTSFTLRGFQGDYDVVVLYHDKPIKRQTFSLGKTDQTVDVTISGSGHEIQIPVKKYPF